MEEGIMTLFKRMAYQKMLTWKKDYSAKYALLLEGARRTGKTTLALEFAKNEFKSYIFIDFSKKDVREKFEDCFNHISDLNYFFLTLNALTGVTLYEHQSLIIFDEVQSYPYARQCIKYLVQDGRYSYLETGSLISIKRNVKDILIPSEEMRLEINPLNYEEFLGAINKNNYDSLRQIFERKASIGPKVNEELMKTFRLYLVVGGMPQAIEEYLKTNDLNKVDKVKREILSLYEDDFYKLDRSGLLSKIFHSIPSQLQSKRTRFSLSMATDKKRQSVKDEELLSDLIDSKTVLVCNNVSDPSSNLPASQKRSEYKIYLSDVGLFTSLISNERESHGDSLYGELLLGKNRSNLGYLYENVVAQLIHSYGNDLFYYSWYKDDKSKHLYEIDFLLPDNKGKRIPIEVKSASIKSYHSLDEFLRKYPSLISQSYIISGKDLNKHERVRMIPFYLCSFVFEKHCG